MDDINFPNDPGEIDRRLKALENQLALQASRRSLTQSSIGGGGLRTFGGGSISIDGTGSMIIEEGDLVLGEGTIDGAALQDQISVQQQTVGIKTFTVSDTNWATVASLSIDLPSWASRAVVNVQTNVQMPGYGLLRGYISTTGLTATNLALPDSELNLTVCSGSLAWGGVLTGSGTVRVDAQNTNSGYKGQGKAELTATTIFFR